MAAMRRREAEAPPAALTPVRSLRALEAFLRLVQARPATRGADARRAPRYATAVFALASAGTAGRFATSSATSATTARTAAV